MFVNRAEIGREERLTEAMRQKVRTEEIFGRVKSLRKEVSGGKGIQIMGLVLRRSNGVSSVVRGLIERVSQEWHSRLCRLRSIFSGSSCWSNR